MKNWNIDKEFYLFFAVWGLIVLLLGGCASDSKIRVKKCIRINDDYFECEIIPERPERGGRFRY